MHWIPYGTFWAPSQVSVSTKFPPEQLEKLNTILLSLALLTLCASSACVPWSVLKENKLIGAAVP